MKKAISSMICMVLLSWIFIFEDPSHGTMYVIQDDTIDIMVIWEYERVANIWTDRGSTPIPYEVAVRAAESVIRDDTRRLSIAPYGELI